MLKKLSLLRMSMKCFVLAMLAYFSGMLIVLFAAENVHKNFFAHIGLPIDNELMAHLHQDQINLLAPVAVFFFIVTTAVCLRFCIVSRTLLVSEDNAKYHLNRIQVLLDSTQEGIYGTDHDGRCTLANKACAKLLGYDSPDELLGQPVHELMHHTRPDGKPYPVEECSAHKMSETGIISAIEDEVFWRKDGSFFPVSFNVLPMRNGDQIIGMVCTFTDITEKLQIEEQLRQAQKMEAVGQLSGGIAHDFNNILQIVSNNTRVAMDKFGIADPLHSVLEETLEAVQRGASLTRSMLAFSRKQFMRIRPLDLNQLLADSLVLGQKLMPETIQLKFQPYKEPLMVRADGTLIQQVLFNLLTNARDAMPEGGTITITTSLTEVDKEVLELNLCSHRGFFALLSVSDQGCGIPENIRCNIFDPFFTTKNVGQGTGLGLSMIYGTMHQHGGFVTVDSSSEVGTTFVIYLPV